MLVSSLLADEKTLSQGQKTQATPPRLNSVCVGAGIYAHGLSPWSQLPGHTAAHTIDQHSRPEYPPCCKNPTPSQQLRRASRAFCSEVTSRQRALGHLCLLYCRGEVRGKDMARGSQGSEPGVWNLGGEARPSAIQLSSEVIPCVKHLSWLHWFPKESSSPALCLDARMCLPAKQIKFFLP